MRGMGDADEDIDSWGDVQLTPFQEVEAKRLLKQYRDEDRRRIRVALLGAAVIAAGISVWAVLL